MPSCDGSNCGACACACECEIREKIIYKNDPALLVEIRKLEREVQKLRRGIEKEEE